jgi:hypothetical protein
MKRCYTFPLSVPPTYVNITGEKDGNILTLNCTTDSSNPVAVLSWYKGEKDVASDNFRIISNYQKVIVDADYHGKNKTQSLDINVDDVKDGEKAFCCAEQVQTEICESFLLTPFRETCEYQKNLSIPINSISNRYMLPKSVRHTSIVYVVYDFLVDKNS